MAEYIEGKRAVLEAFKTNVPATCLYVAEGSHGDKNVSDLVKRAHKMGLSVKQVKRDQLDKRSERGSHQGVMLETKPLEEERILGCWRERKGSAMHLGCADGRQARARHGQRRNGPCASYARAVRFPREPSSGGQYRLAQRCAGGHRLHVRMDASGARSGAKLIGSLEL